MKTIYACKNSKFKGVFGILIAVVSVAMIMLYLIKGDSNDFWGFYAPIISFGLNLILGLCFYFSKCNRYFVKFDTDKLIFKTRKNKRTEVNYKDIEAPEIHIFEIKLPLKNGKTISMNLDAFSYEQLRKIKQEILNHF